MSPVSHRSPYSVGTARTSPGTVVLDEQHVLVGRVVLGGAVPGCRYVQLLPPTTKIPASETYTIVDTVPRMPNSDLP